ncbi:hypothetical protein Tco_1466914 [Tanacetum coccineum]
MGTNASITTDERKPLVKDILHIDKEIGTVKNSGPDFGNSSIMKLNKMYFYILYDFNEISEKKRKDEAKNGQNRARNGRA